jgi:hypothetical protein
MIFSTKMTARTLALVATVALTAMLSTGCDKDDDTAEENITTIEVHLTGSGGLDQKFFWDDTDGDGSPNTLDTIVVPAFSSNIQCHLHVYDRSVSPEVNLTEEIEEESRDHLFRYTLSGVTNLTIGDLDTDPTGAPLGIRSVWTAGPAGQKGTLRLQLFHEPTDKNAADPGGDVDFDVNFPVVVR